MRTLAAALAAAVALGVSLPAPAGAGDASTRPASRNPLEADSVRLGAAGDLRSGPSGTVQSGRLGTAPYEMVAVTWRGTATPRVSVRTRSAGSWSGWHELAPLTGHAPDTGSGRAARGSALSATELWWTGPSDGVQVRFDGTAGRRPRVILVDPGRLASDAPTGARTGASPATPGTDSADPTQAPRPRIRSRRAWGADESWRDGAPRYNRTIKQAHVHHTAGSNDYSRSDVPAIIRGAYFYHTQVLGWSDLGYNFVVDRFGRIWEGRAGGVDRPVRGAHTLGFNHASSGVAAIGDFDEARPSKGLVRALVRLSAWKLDAYDREPAGHTWVRSEGSDRYPEGRRVRLPVVDGHRDTNETVCPGDALYAKLPEIRRRAQQRADAVHAGAEASP